MAFYPQLREEQIMTLNVVVQNLEKDPQYLNSAECPYSDTIKTFFRKLAGPAPVVNPFEGAEDYNMVLDQQIEQVIAELDQFAGTLGNADHSERLQYFKTKTTLVEKLIGMKERVQNLKELNEFRGTILAFLDEACTPDQITQIMKRLDGVFGVTA